MKCEQLRSDWHKSSVVIALINNKKRDYTHSAICPSQYSKKNVKWAYDYVFGRPGASVFDT